MSASLQTHAPVNSRVEALRAKHQSLKEQVENAQKTLSSTDFYLQQLKKEKLMLKEAINQEEGKIAANA